ncbi:MAG: zf-HC2 domain-containing protein, partial [Pyrinomonadaceae bacterium]|nr:zf-HC2 domain-containing protein [Pyrinomonadaceae bacterium]
MFSRTVCARTAKRLPLYLSSELKPRAAHTVAAHLEACENCRALASEYRTSQEWIKQAARQVDFADEFYEQLRQSVLTRIKEQNLTPPASFFPAHFWQQRPAFAAAALIVILLTAALAAQLVFRQLPRARPGQQASVMPIATVPGPVQPPLSGPHEPQRAGVSQPTDQAQHDIVANARRPQSRAAGRRIARQPAPATVPDESPTHSAGTVGIDMEL